MRKGAFVSAVVSFLLIACMLLAPPTQNVDEIVQATLQALTAQAEGTEVGHVPIGSLSGQLGYPSEAIPPLRVVAFDTDSDQFYFVETSYNQIVYQITGLPAGTYYVVAYTLGGGSFPPGLAGGFTYATLCGLTVDCTDHSLAPVIVSPGQDTPNISPNDWYAEENAFPPMPGPAPSAGTGSITGSLSYPSEFIPPLRVFAFQVGSENYFYVDTVENQTAYRIDNLPAGYYQVVAYILSGNYAGAYTQAVLCGLSIDCTDHSLIEVPVNSGQTVTDIDPGDWYAPEGTFPLAPVLP
jgi:hypothetical protein